MVIGRECRYLASRADALAHVAGCMIANDVSERSYQLEQSGGQWSKGKSCQTFNPLGPWLVPTEDLGDLQRLGLRSFVNDEPRQGSTTADMIFSVAELVWDLSQYLVLEPGDVINTGTPEALHSRDVSRTWHLAMSCVSRSTGLGPSSRRWSLHAEFRRNLHPADRRQCSAP